MLRGPPRKWRETGRGFLVVLITLPVSCVPRGLAGRARRCWALAENWCAPPESPPYPVFIWGPQLANPGRAHCMYLLACSVTHRASEARPRPCASPSLGYLANSYPFLKTAFWHHLNKTLTPPFRPNSSFSPLYIKKPFIVETFSKGTSRILLQNFCTVLPLLYYPRGKGASGASVCHAATLAAHRTRRKATRPASQMEQKLPSGPTHLVYR